MIRLTHMPTFDKEIKRLQHLLDLRLESYLDAVGAAGVKALAAATPIDTGASARSWYYTKDGSNGRYTIKWHNSVRAGSVPLVVLLDSGHVTGTGGYVTGIHFIGPAIQPEYDHFREVIHKEVNKR